VQFTSLFIIRYSVFDITLLIGCLAAGTLPPATDSQNYLAFVIFFIPSASMTHFLSIGSKSSCRVRFICRPHATNATPAY
jgi:hypothetical protein